MDIGRGERGLHSAAKYITQKSKKLINPVRLRLRNIGPMTTQFTSHDIYVIHDTI